MEGEIFLPNPGDAWLWTCAGGPFVINLLTQEGWLWGGQTSGKGEYVQCQPYTARIKKDCGKKRIVLGGTTESGHRRRGIRLGTGGATDPESIKRS